MNRLQAELHRLYLPRARAGNESATRPSLIDAEGKVRAMVMEVTGPPDWSVLSKVWNGVQSELGLAAPAIAVSGTDGLQLWFSLDAPIAVSRAHELLESLRLHFLPDVDSKRVRLMPDPDAASQRRDLHARLPPAEQAEAGNWSAFLAPDLAPVFAETPWLDIPPNEEGQASLLRSLSVMKQPAFEAAFGRLVANARPQSSPPTSTTTGDAPGVRSSSTATAVQDDAERFLIRVMNDESVTLALRIEAAKALLPRPGDHRPR